MTVTALYFCSDERCSALDHALLSVYSATLPTMLLGAYDPHTRVFLYEIPQSCPFSLEH